MAMETKPGLTLVAGRDVAAAGAATGLAPTLMSMVHPAVRAGARAGGTDAPEKTELKVGFMPLTDCAPVVIAASAGFDRKYGIAIKPVKQASWAGVRDNLATGEIDAAHVLYGLVYGLHLGIGGLRKDMAVLMTLNQNGQGITLSNLLRERGATDGAKLHTVIRRDRRECTFAQTFPTGTHAMWLYYWLAAHGIHPLCDVNTIVVRPPQMIAHLRLGTVDGCYVGEPWNARAIREGIGFTVATSQDVWPDHPEKVLATTAEFVRSYPNCARALTMAVLDAARFADAQANRPKVARILADQAYVDAQADVIEQRLLGNYENGLGRTWKDANAVKFHDGGAVNFPYLSDGMWFLTQFRRWGLLGSEPDYQAVAARINQTDLYRQAAEQIGVSAPAQPVRASRLIDGVTWNGTDPAGYAGTFGLKAA